MVQNSLSDHAPSETPMMNKYVFGCAVLVSMTSILLGYDIGVMSGALIFIQEDLHINNEQLLILIGILNYLYSFIGSIVAGRTSDWIGRKYTIVLAVWIFFVGALLTSLAPNYACLMVGRLVSGISIGFVFTIAPIYTTEVSPASSRGFFTSFPEVFINVGTLLGYLSTYTFSKFPEQLSWRFMLGIGAIPSFLLGVGVLTLPESPHWLVMRGRLGDARYVLSKTSYSNEEAMLRFAEIKESAGIQIPEENCNDDVVIVSRLRIGLGVWKELLIHPTPPIRRVLIAAIGIHFLQQSTGIDAIIHYSPHIFKMAGITRKSYLLDPNIAIGLIKTLSIFVATFLVDKIGRRQLLLSSIGGMVLSLAGLGVGLMIIVHTETKSTWVMVLSIVMVILYVAFYSIGLGPVTWIYSSEIFPMRLRSQGVSIGVGVNRVTSAALSLSFTSLGNVIKFGGICIVFAGIAMVGWLYINSFLPETGGKTLEEIEVLFADLNWKASKKKDRFLMSYLLWCGRVRLTWG